MSKGRQRRGTWRVRVARDPWLEMADRARRDEQLPPTVKVVADSFAKRYRDKGMKRIRWGYGGRTEYADEFGRVHHCKPGMAEATGHSRRSMIRARHLLVERGYLVYLPGGGAQHKSCGRGGRGRAADRTAADRPFVVRMIGNGGRKAGGEGLANEYMPASEGGSDVAVDLAPEEPPTEPGKPRRPLRQVLEESRGRGP